MAVITVDESNDDDPEADTSLELFVIDTSDDHDDPSVNIVHCIIISWSVLSSFPQHQEYQRVETMVPPPPILVRGSIIIIIGLLIIYQFRKFVWSG